MAFVLPPQLTLAQVRSELERLQTELAARPAALQVDAAALSDFDTGALALLLEGRRQAGAAGLGFEVQGAPVGLRQLAALHGVDGLLGLTPA